MQWNKPSCFFVLGLLLGDNLGVNAALGYRQCFIANYCCRFCKCSINEIQSSIRIKDNVMRSVANYNSDLILDNPQLTGINENSIFNSFSQFHVTENFSVDLMHDFFEGVARYNMAHIINYLITQKYFSIDTINDRKNLFKYGETEIENI